MGSIIEETLAVHNALRAAHGAAPLKWSDECAELAQAQAEVCAEMGGAVHGNTEGESGEHGQNVCMAQHRHYGETIEQRYGEVTPTAAIKIWYNEVNEPGYDFDSHGFHDGTAHFTQVVWAETTHVGLAISGQYVCANYLPAGNSMMDGSYEDNVLPSKTTDFDEIVGAAAKKKTGLLSFFGFNCCTKISCVDTDGLNVPEHPDGEDSD